MGESPDGPAALGRGPRAAGVLAGLGVAAATWAVVETRLFALRTAEVPVLAPGAAPLRVLHLSDLHLTPSQQLKQRWVAGLGRLRPDLVVATGDFLAHPDAVAPVMRSIDALLDVPGCFVLGSNDYYAPRPKDPSRYLRRDDGRRVLGEQLPWPELVAALTARGWLDLDNARGALVAAGRAIDLRGVDDSHVDRDDYAAVAGPADPRADLRMAVMHSPEPRNVDAAVDDGCELVLAGHTHGGQLRVPGYGALVTNCGLPRDRARGLSPWGHGAFLHVSAGLGTSPFAPARFACRPEATLLTLRPGRDR